MITIPVKVIGQTDDELIQTDKKTTRSDKTESLSSTFNSYNYNKLGISLEHPPDWKFASLKNGIQLIKEKNGVYVEIRKHNLDSSNTKLEQYVGDDIKDRSSSREDLKLLNITKTTIFGNLPAYKTEYTFLKTEDQKDFSFNGTTNKILRFWTFANGNAYTVAYVSEMDDYDLDLPIALKIIDTLKINPGSQHSFSDNDSNDDKKKSNNSNDDKKKSNNSNDDKKKGNDSNDDKKKGNDSNDNNDDSKGNDNDYKDKDGDGDIDCKDTGKNVKVGSDDPYDLDRDGDGIGCDG
jgi:hypothetical protein